MFQLGKRFPCSFPEFLFSGSVWIWPASSVFFSFASSGVSAWTSSTKLSTAESKKLFLNVMSISCVASASVRVKKLFLPSLTLFTTFASLILSKCQLVVLGDKEIFWAMASLLALFSCSRNRIIFRVDSCLKKAIIS